MSMNSLSSARFAPPQQAHLNPQVVQQRQGVKFDPAEEAVEAFVRFGEIVNVPGGAQNNVNPYLYDDVLNRLERMLKSTDDFTGQFMARINKENPLSSVFEVSVNRELPEGCQGVSPSHAFEFYPTDSREKVQNHFADALDYVGRIEKRIEAHLYEEKNLYEEKIGRQVPRETRQQIRNDAENLFGESGTNSTSDA
jgi:hypothetical protein